MADDVRESKLNNLLSTRGFKDLRSGENRKQRELLADSLRGEPVLEKIYEKG